MTLDSAFFDELLKRFVFISPMILLCLVGMVIAFTKTKRARKPAILAIVAMGITLLINIAYGIVTTCTIVAMQQTARTGIGSTFSAAWFVEVVEWVWKLGLTVGIAILIWAVFTGRSPQQSDE